jgi:hypothetical protein
MDVEQTLEAYQAQGATLWCLNSSLVASTGTQRDLQKRYKGHSPTSDEGLRRRHDWTSDARSPFYPGV